MSKQYRYKQLFGVFTGAALMGVCGSVSAAGFEISEQNGAGLATSYAGVASIAEDASTGWYNPAGLVRLDQEQVAFSLVTIWPYSKISARRATPTFRLNPAGDLNIAPGHSRLHNNAAVPGLHYFHRINCNWVFGFNIVMPFGLKTKYSRKSVARYMSTRAELRSFDITPSLAYDFGNGLSFGAGVDFVHAQAKLDSRIGFGDIRTDGFQENTASRWGVGGHAGLLYQFTDCTRIGLAYHSEVKIKPKGDSILQTPAVNPLNPLAPPNPLNPVFLPETRQGVRSKVTLPDHAALSMFHQFNEVWSVMADVKYTHWKTFRHLTLKFVDGSKTIFNEKFKDSWRYALGIHIQPDDCWRFGIGGGWEQSPVKNRHRTTAIPDSDRTWASLGVQYRFFKCLALDLGYAHLFFKKCRINQPTPRRVNAPRGTPPSFQTIQGRYKRSRADLVGAQLTWDLG